MTYLLKRTTTETFSIDFAHLQELTKFRAGTDDKTTIEQALNLGGGPLARDAEALVLAEFDLYDGSIMGDMLFTSRADQDSGTEIIDEED